MTKRRRQKGVDKVSHSSTPGGEHVKSVHVECVPWRKIWSRSPCQMIHFLSPPLPPPRAGTKNKILTILFFGSSAIHISFFESWQGQCANPTYGDGGGDGGGTG